MNRLRSEIALSLPAIAVSLGGALLADDEAGREVQVSLCDGDSTISVAGLRAGQVLERGDAQHLAGQMTQVWPT